MAPIASVFLVSKILDREGCATLCEKTKLWGCRFPVLWRELSFILWHYCTRWKQAGEVYTFGFLNLWKMQERVSVFEVIFPLGGKIQVIRKSSGGRAIMIMFCRCSCCSQCYIIWMAELCGNSAGLLPQQVLALFDKQGREGARVQKATRGPDFFPHLSNSTVMCFIEGRI